MIQKRLFLVVQGFGNFVSESGSFLGSSVCSPLRAFLNSKIPCPKAFAISGTRLAPKSNRTINRIITSSDQPIIKISFIDANTLTDEDEKNQREFSS